jgi:hypothetical protein
MRRVIPSLDPRSGSSGAARPASSFLSCGAHPIPKQESKTGSLVVTIEDLETLESAIEELAGATYIKSRLVLIRLREQLEIEGGVHPVDAKDNTIARLEKELLLEAA